VPAASPPHADAFIVGGTAKTCGTGPGEIPPAS
jgi:hypothetical protein